MDKKSLETAFNKELVPHGFKKKASSWYRQTIGALQVVDLQKSAYGGQFYVNLCFVPDGMAVDGMPTPKEYKCPLRIRLDSVFPENSKQLEELFDLEGQSLSETSRTKGVQDVLIRMVIPFLDQLREPNDLRQGIIQGMFSRGLVNLAAQKHFGIDLNSGNQPQWT